VNDPNEKKLFNAEFLELIKSEGLQLASDMLVTGKYMGEIEAIARGRKCRNISYVQAENSMNPRDPTDPTAEVQLQLVTRLWAA
jgi:hypothetical protein